MNQTVNVISRENSGDGIEVRIEYDGKSILC